MSDPLLLLLGVLCAGIGGDIFIRGAVGLSIALRVPAGLIGATIAAFATSSPELSVSISSALAGRPGIALGDAVGSNIVNIGAILGIGLLLCPIHVSRVEIRRDFFAALLVPVLTAGLASDGSLSRADGALLLGAFAVWLVANIRSALHHRSNSSAESLPSAKPLPALLLTLLGLALLVAAGRFVVAGATGLARAFGMPPFFIGVTVVAFGTSVPELAAILAAARKGHQEVALGTILGSNLFNGLGIVGTAAAISPIAVVPGELHMGLITGFVLVGATYPTVEGILGRARGVALLTLYLGFLTAAILTRS